MNPDDLVIGEEMKQAKEINLQLDSDMSAILQTISDDNGLAVEILWTAMMHIKNNPTCSITDAIDVGYEEWIK